MRDIFAPSNAGDGQYGTEALEGVIEVGNGFYDLYGAVYDDKKINYKDLYPVATMGPALAASVEAVVENAGQLDDEITDLSEAEKARLNQLAGERLNDPSYKKIISGLLDIVDGLSEKFGSGANPVH